MWAVYLQVDIGIETAILVGNRESINLGNLYYSWVGGRKEQI